MAKLAAALFNVLLRLMMFKSEAPFISKMVIASSCIPKLGI